MHTFSLKQAYIDNNLFNKKTELIVYGRFENKASHSLMNIIE